MPDPKRKADGPIGRPLLQGALAIAASAIAATPAPALADTFLRLGTIKGESVEAKHKDQIEILSFTQSLINSADFSTAGGGAVGKLQCGAITMMKNIDKSSPLLMKAVATGENIADGVISFTQQDSSGRQLDYYTITLQNVFVTELSQTDTQDPNKVFEKLVLKSQAFEFKYTPITVKGSIGTPVSFKWDCAENKGG